MTSPAPPTPGTIRQTLQWFRKLPTPPSHIGHIPRSTSTRPAPTPSRPSIPPPIPNVHGFPGIALLHHRERDASSVGHAGAGVFWTTRDCSSSRPRPRPHRPQVLEWKHQGHRLIPRRTSAMEKQGPYSLGDCSRPMSKAVRCESETSSSEIKHAIQVQEK
ncbi:hypothetical protein L210DRAFT_584231 [Boletus edulis BED1]|uniref:Uncharacterized protein n=1 Tax=Boletus edulis BED1 TaxID=1328754 RepID=A0AAD4GKN5_BOLED|nr:hypothetical protein L210DRAFT_584231 [Boletus edulis BED1]